jgi:hypothetical protein
MLAAGTLEAKNQAISVQNPVVERQAGPTSVNALRPAAEKIISENCH